MIDIVSFSRNRPLQLYSFLESLEDNTDARFSSNVSVIYRYDDPFLEGLGEVKNKFGWVNFINQDNMRNDVLVELEKSKNEFCVFFVDDIIIKDSVSFSSVCETIKTNPGILTFSLRMGLNLDFCYPTSSPQPIPDGIIRSGLFAWDWRSGQGDWGYPMSVDGHIFRKSEMISWISSISFQNPNQFEDRLQPFKSMNEKVFCACYTMSKIVNLPMNRVQDEYKNRSEEMRAEDLLEWWNEGKKIDVESLMKIKNNSAHFPVKIKLKERK